MLLTKVSAYFRVYTAGQWESERYNAKKARQIGKQKFICTKLRSVEWSGSEQMKVNLITAEKISQYVNNYWRFARTLVAQRTRQRKVRRKEMNENRMFRHLEADIGRFTTAWRCFLSVFVFFLARFYLIFDVLSSASAIIGTNRRRSKGMRNCGAFDCSKLMCNIFCLVAFNSANSWG